MRRALNSESAFATSAILSFAWATRPLLSSLMPFSTSPPLVEGLLVLLRQALGEALLLVLDALLHFGELLGVLRSDRGGARLHARGERLLRASDRRLGGLHFRLGRGELRFDQRGNLHGERVHGAREALPPASKNWLTSAGRSRIWSLIHSSEPPG